MITLGDENSLQGRTQAHKHSSASSDGSFLSTGITGLTGSSNGSMVYFDGGNIAQDLAPTVNGDILELSGGLPTWVTPAGLSSVWTELVNSKLVVAGGLDGSWIGQYDILSGYIFSQPDGANVSGITYNSDNSTSYGGVSTIHPGGYSGERSNDIYGSAATALTNFNFTHFWIYNNADKQKLSRITATCGTGIGSAPTLWDSWQTYDGVASAINSIQCVCRNTGTAQDFKPDSHLVVMGAN